MPCLIIEEAAMSKVIHLSDDAHNKAKAFCKEQGLKMSDWVASLIDAAIASGGAPAMVIGAAMEDNVRALVQKKKVLEHYEERPQTAEDGLPVYAAPPFWAKAHGR
jgi:hypothetical protein